MENKEVSMGEAFGLFWSNYVNFGGRSSRSEYWWMFLWNLIIGFVAMIIPIIGPVALFVYGIASIIPGIALYARRLRDVGLSTGVIILVMILTLVPFLGGILGIIMACQPSKPVETSGKAQEI